jgi:hypothetical protein
MEALPEGTHLIHIGPQKTGSTAIQAAMHTLRPVLREHGVLYPGPGARPREAADVGLGFGRTDGRTHKTMEPWDDLLRQVRDPGHRRVCISLEAFGRATDEQIKRIIHELGGERPHVLMAARRYDSLMPSQWQQRVKSQVTLSFEEWLQVVLGPADPDNPHWRNLWVPHDTVSLVQRWADVVGDDNLTLVVLDEARRDHLHRTIESLLALPTGLLDVEGLRQNQSLTYPQVEVLRQLNLLFQRRSWTNREYHDLVRQGVVPRLLAAPAPPGEPRIPALPHWARERLLELSDQRIEGLRALPVRVVGDLEALRVRDVVAPDQVLPPDGMVSIQTSVLALEGLLGSSRRRLREQRRELREEWRAERRRLRKQVKAAKPRPAVQTATGPGTRPAARPGRLGRVLRRARQTVSRAG